MATTPLLISHHSSLLLLSPNLKHDYLSFQLHLKGFHYDVTMHQKNGVTSITFSSSFVPFLSSIKTNYELIDTQIELQKEHFLCVLNWVLIKELCSPLPRRDGLLEARTSQFVKERLSNLKKKKGNRFEPIGKLISYMKANYNINLFQKTMIPKICLHDNSHFRSLHVKNYAHNFPIIFLLVKLIKTT